MVRFLIVCIGPLYTDIHQYVALQKSQRPRKHAKQGENQSLNLKRTTNQNTRMMRTTQTMRRMTRHN